MSNITFVIFAFNEEKRIEACIHNLLKYGEVLVMDGGSTDNTKGIVEKMGGKFITRPAVKWPLVESEEMFEFVKNLVHTQWVFWGFADNILPQKLLEKMAEVSRQDKIKYVYIPMYTFLWGDVNHVMEKGYSPRFFRVDKMDFAGNRLHSLGKFLGGNSEELHLPMQKDMAMLHFSLYDLGKFIPAHLLYAEVEARQWFESGKKFSTWRMFGSMARYFWLFFRYGFRSKDKGLLIAMLYAFFRFMVFFRLYELEQGITLGSIESEFAKAKENLLIKP